MSKGKERLAPAGYYITYYGAKTDNPTEYFGFEYIDPIGKCNYIHWSWGKEWNTLTWTCATTKKALERELAAADDVDMDRTIYFSTHEELCQHPLATDAAKLLPPLATIND